jgi:hypothetical protein
MLDLGGKVYNRPAMQRVAHVMLCRILYLPICTTASGSRHSWSADGVRSYRVFFYGVRFVWKHAMKTLMSYVFVVKNKDAEDAALITKQYRFYQAALMQSYKKNFSDS